MYKKRTVNFADVMTVRDDRNGIYAELVFNPDQRKGFTSYFWSSKTRADYFEGVICTYDDIHYKKRRNTKNAPNDYLAKIEGHWLEEMRVGGEQYWHIDEFKPYAYRERKDPLPSDARYREDLVCLKFGDIPEAQVWKEKLENIQRNDRKLRANAEKARGGKKKGWLF